MRSLRVAGTIPLILSIAGCASTAALSGGSEPLRYNSAVEFVEVEGLTAASENVLIPLGPGRSYWFNATDGSRWAADDPIVPPTTRVIIWHEGIGRVATNTDMQDLRHVGGRLDLKKGWYGRVFNVQSTADRRAILTLEDGRRLEVNGARRLAAVGVPFDVVVPDDGTRVFALRSGVELIVAQELPAQ